MLDIIDKLASSIQTLDFDSVFICDDISRTNITYNQFFRTCITIADCIGQKFDSVCVILENGVLLSTLYFIGLFRDIKVVSIDPQKEYDEIMRELEPYLSVNCAVVCEEQYKSRLPLNANILNLQYLPQIPLEDSNIRTALLTAVQKKDYDLPYLITFTSGTSGNCKGVQHSLGNLLRTAYALHERVPLPSEARLLHVMPMSYMAGILNSLFYPFIAGISIVIGDRFSIPYARSFWKRVIQYNANVFWLSPSMLNIIDKLDRDDSGEHYCRENKTVFLIGTAGLSNEMRDRFNTRYGVSVFASYGLSETLFISVETRESLDLFPAGCVGTLLSGVEYRLNNGELLVNVPWMFQKYTNVDSSDYFVDGFYKTGDLVEFSDAVLKIVGRSKDLIIKGGMNISPVLIEETILQNPAVSECCVIGVLDRSHEEKICCVYTIKEAENPTELEKILKRTVLEKHGKYYSIDYFWRVETILRNVNGKTDKNKLRALWEESHE